MIASEPLDATPVACGALAEYGREDPAPGGNAVVFVESGVDTAMEAGCGRDMRFEDECDEDKEFEESWHDDKTGN